MPEPRCSRFGRSRHWSRGVPLRPLKSAAGPLLELIPIGPTGGTGRRIYQARNDLAGARYTAAQGLERNPKDCNLRLLAAELSLQSGAIADGIALLRALEPEARADADALQHIAQMFTRLNLHFDAERCYRRAVERTGSTISLQSCHIRRCARKDGRGGTDLDQVISRAPQDYDAYYNRATLRRQTPGQNHVAQIETMLQAVAQSHGRSAARLCPRQGTGGYGRARSPSRRPARRGRAAKASLLAWMMTYGQWRRLLRTFIAMPLRAASPATTTGSPSSSSGFPEAVPRWSTVS